MHIDKTLNCISLGIVMWSISCEIDIEGMVEYNLLVNCIATDASIVQNRVTVNQICVDVFNFVGVLSRQS